ncbi:hypothetical protein MA16_Dca013177 [Dendrobium catenatum]|uniref:Uncharacterized protein n=1 Tax=Dendrobium catenatum TaxID=906689 RepID=A0A2I0WR51_9ASPA|nr:hypothetical protein MA16_Dca013177 [Dendrobium catenatum]
MNSDSAAGADGYTTKFFVKAWNIVKVDVLAAVNDFFKGTPYPKFFSFIILVLIPKKDVTNKWMDFRHISLCSFFNKLVSKI